MLSLVRLFLLVQVWLVTVTLNPLSVNEVEVIENIAVDEAIVESSED